MGKEIFLYNMTAEYNAVMIPGRNYIHPVFPATLSSNIACAVKHVPNELRFKLAHGRLRLALKLRFTCMRDPWKSMRVALCVSTSPMCL